MTKPIEPLPVETVRAKLIEMGWSPEDANNILGLLTDPDREAEFIKGFGAFMDTRFPEGT